MPSLIDRQSSTFLAARVAAFALWCSVALATPGAVAQSQETPTPAERAEFVEITEPMAVIPPGKENLLAEMLGRGTTLPGECKFSNGQIDRATVNATYTCSGGTVVVALAHPDKAAPEATITERFAITVKNGTPPAGLIEDLASRVRAREGEFEWTWLEPTVKPGSSRLLVIVAVVAGAVLLLALGRRRRQAKAL